MPRITSEGTETQKHKRKQTEEKKQASETHSGITQTLEVSYEEFKITMVNMIRALESKQHFKHRQVI